MNLNVDKAIPRKLSIALATMGLLKVIEPTDIVKIVCIAIVGVLAMLLQWDLDRPKLKKVKPEDANL